jgi:hypothetical protein
MPNLPYFALSSVFIFFIISKLLIKAPSYCTTLATLWIDLGFLLPSDVRLTIFYCIFKGKKRKKGKSIIFLDENKKFFGRFLKCVDISLVWQIVEKKVD